MLARQTHRIVQKVHCFDLLTSLNGILIAAIVLDPLSDQLKLQRFNDYLARQPETDCHGTLKS